MIVIGDPTDLDALRLRDEFLSLPGLRITVPQTARLLGVRRDHAAAILQDLEREGFLIHDATDSYERSQR